MAWALLWPRPEELSQSAAGARSALEYRGLVGRGRAIYIGDLEPDASRRLEFMESDEEALSSAVKLGGEEEIRAQVEYLTERVRASGLAMSQCQLFFLELLMCLLRLTRGRRAGGGDRVRHGFTGAVQAADFTTPEQMGRCAWTGV